MEPLIRSFAAKAGLQLSHFAPLSGGDINQAFHLACQEGDFFLKANQLPSGHEMLLAEVDGLQAMSAAGAQCPKIIKVGQSEDWAYLILSYHPAEPAQPKFWPQFAEQLGQMHQATAPQHGWPKHNFIGSLVQSNSQHTDWPSFYQQQRLIPQLQLATSKQLISSQEEALCIEFFKKLPTLLPNESPSLLHGDLWSGNFITTADQAILIDPACSYGHREMDLAMSRLFGGFDASFYAAYEHNFPLLPGHESRIPIYQLYYLFVHLNLFGRGYWGQIKSIMTALL